MLRMREIETIGAAQNRRVEVMGEFNPCRWSSNSRHAGGYAVCVAVSGLGLPMGPVPSPPRSRNANSRNLATQEGSSRTRGPMFNGRLW